MTSDWKQTLVCRIDGYEIDTRATNGKGYGKISLGDVFALVEQPGPDRSKGHAPAAIYSTYCDHDARAHSVQKAQGNFAALWLDIDDGSHTLDVIAEAICAIAASDFAWAIYSTASATQNAPRWRVIVPLASPLPFERWAIAQRTLSKLLRDQGIVSDTVTERAGQVAILPISRPFYQAKSNLEDEALDVENDRLFAVALQETENAEQESIFEQSFDLTTESAHRLWEARQASKSTREDAPIHWFNHRTTVEKMLAAYGYVRKSPNSDDWRSPLQSSTSYATRDFGDYWVSLSGSDAAAQIGAACGSGRFGDAFDLFVHFEHSGDFSSAVKAATAAMPNLVARSEIWPSPEHDEGLFKPLTADDLGLGGQDRLRKAINAEGKPSPASAAYGLAVSTLNQGYSENQVMRLLLTPANRASKYCLGATDPIAAANQVIEWSQNKIAEQPHNNWGEEGWPETTGLNPDDFYFIAPQGRCIYLPTRDLWPVKTIDGAFKSNGRDSEWFAGNRLAEQMIWAPGEPQVIGDRLMAAGSWQDMPGATVINTYLPGPSLAGGEPHKAALWVELVKRVYPNEAEHLFDCFAQRLQRPQDKINHAIVLGGQQGIGKDSLLEPVKEAVGHWNWADISPSHAMGRFNGFLKSIVLRISEARDLGDRDRFAFYDRAKTWMAAPPDVHTIDEKNMKEYPAQNVTFVIITTNRQDALHLEPDDRRHFVAWSDLSKEDFTGEYWTNYYRWLNEEGGKAHVAAFLRQRNLAEFDAKAPPPKTPAFWSILQAGQSPETLELSDALEKMGWPDVVCIQAIMSSAGDLQLGWLTERGSAKRVPSRLGECGYQAVPNPEVKDGRWRFEDGSKRMVYVRSTINVTARIFSASNYARFGHPR